MGNKQKQTPSASEREPGLSRTLKWFSVRSYIQPSAHFVSSWEWLQWQEFTSLPNRFSHLPSALASRLLWAEPIYSMEETQHQVKPWLLGDSPVILEDRVMSLLVPLGLSLLSPAANSPRRLVYIPKPQATHSCLMLLSMKRRNGWQAYGSSQWVVIHNIWSLQNLKWQYRARV